MSKAKKKLDLSKLSREEKLQLIEALERKSQLKKERKSAFVPHEGQLAIIKSPARIKMVTAANGCWAPGTLIRMFDGSTKAVEDIKVGDKLMGPDSQEREVLRLYSGTEEMYRVVPQHSDPYTVNASHILALKKWCKLRVNEEGYKKDGSVIRDVNVTVADYLKWGKEQKRISYQWRPKDGVEYAKKQLAIDPYILGTWLGDGHSRGLALTTMDDTILNAWLEYFKGYKVTKYTKANNKASTYKFTQSIRSPNIGSYGRAELVKLNLINNKHIPEVFKLSNRQQRLELLAGLIDTDGYYNNTTNYEITQVRERLADDIRELAQSLGLSVTKKIKVINGKNYYRLTIAGDIHTIPVKLGYKKANATYRKQRPRQHEGFELENLGPGAFFGFEVNKDNLLLLADYTVQHNSGKTCVAVNMALWDAHGYNPVTKEHSKVPAKIYVVLDSPLKVSTVWIPEIKKWYPLKEEQLKKNGKPYYNQIVFDNGSVINFMFFEQNELLFESLELTSCYWDEPPPQHIFTAMMRGGRTKNTNPKFVMIGTPLSQAWVREFYVEWQKGNKPDTEFFKMNTSANAANLKEGYIEEFSRHLSDAEKATRLEGEFFNAQGMALAPMLDRRKHIIPASQLPADYNQTWPHVISIDPHTAKPLHACMLAVDEKNQKYYVKEYKEKVLPRDFALWLKKNWLAEHHVVDIVCDSAGNAEFTAGEGFKSAIEVMKEEGVRVRATSYDDKSDEKFIQRVQDALYIGPDRAEPQIKFVSGHSEGIIKDIENVQFKRIKHSDDYLPTLDIRNTDYLACLKYALAANLTFTNAHRKPKMYVKTKPALMGKSSQPGYLESKLVYNRHRGRPLDDDDDW